MTAAPPILPMTSIVIMTLFFATTIAIFGWWAYGEHIEFFGTIRTHMINAAIIIAATALVLILTWDLFVALFLSNRSGWPISRRAATRLVVLYEIFPCAVFMARYGVIDLGGHQRARWPMAIGGWAVAGGAAGYLLLIVSVLR